MEKGDRSISGDTGHDLTLSNILLCVGNFNKFDA